LNIARILGTDYFLGLDEIKKKLKQLEGKMRNAAAELEFEQAAKFRDEIRKYEAMDLGLATVRG
jgi:excinuclease ABC subunit B